MNVYPIGRVNTKNIKETSEGHLMADLKKQINHTSGAHRKKKMHQIFFFFRQTQLSVQMFYNMNI